MGTEFLVLFALNAFVFTIFACRVNFKLNQILENQLNIYENLRTVYDVVRRFDTTLYEIRKKEDKWGDYSKKFDQLFSDINKKKVNSMLQNEDTRTMIQCFQIALWMMKEESKDE